MFSIKILYSFLVSHCSYMLSPS